MITFLICLGLLIASYFTYARYLERRFEMDPAAEVPSETLRDGVDYLPLPVWKTFLIQLLNIAGLGPIFGALLGAMYGPVAFVWITVGSIFIGALQDYASGMISLKEGGLSFPEIVGKYMGMTVRQAMRAFTLFLMILVGAVFMVGPAGILEGFTGLTQSVWVWIILVYYVLATLLPIDKIIGRFYPVFGAALFIMAFGILGVLIFGPYRIPDLSASSFGNFTANPAGLPIVPTLFITIACGAVSGFHATQSPMMARCITNQRQGRPVFFGAMISEGVIALIWAAIGMAFWNGTEGLSAALAEHGNNAAWAVDIITNTTLGKAGAFLALLGVVAAPITSGDTAFRCARLIAADFLHMEQKQLRKRLYISVPIFLVGVAITLMPFDVIWKYFAWANQVLAAICLWTVTVYLTVRRQRWIIAFLPAAFMTFIVSFYIFIAEEGLHLPYYTGLAVGTALTAAIVGVMAWYLCSVRRGRIAI
ncbi:carbon starvation protein A [Rikenella microfusus]|uniref:carbon starvation CstA family protein n=1 Tax=Rikenella microfusus TaxID=28139 RepID=UPI003A92FD97